MDFKSISVHVNGSLLAIPIGPALAFLKNAIVGKYSDFKYMIFN